MLKTENQYGFRYLGWPVVTHDHFFKMVWYTSMYINMFRGIIVFIGFVILLPLARADGAAEQAAVYITPWVAVIALFTIGYCVCVRRCTIKRKHVDLELKRAHETDKFQPINVTGPLTYTEGLTGYDSQRPLLEIREGCSYKITGFYDELKAMQKPKLFPLGIVFGSRIPIVPAPTQNNMLHAIVNRQIAERPDYDEGMFELYARQHLCDFARNFSTIENATIATFDQWNSRFPSSKQFAHNDAYLELNHGMWPNMEKMLKALGFLKIEKLSDGKDKDPRNIVGRTPYFKVSYGYWFYNIGNLIKEAHKSDNYGIAYMADLNGIRVQRLRCWYALGTHPIELGQWFSNALKYGGRVVAGDDCISCLNLYGTTIVLPDDGVRHDKHMHEGYENHRQLAYKILTEAYPELTSQHQELVDSIIEYFEEGHEEITTRYGVKYTSDHSMTSGRDDTSVGGSISQDLNTNAFCDIFQFAAINYRKVDDIEGTIRRAHKFTLDAIKDGCGYEFDGFPIINGPYDDVEFLSGLFYPIGDGAYIWGPKIGRQMVKIGWAINKPGSTSRWRNLAGTINSFRCHWYLPFFGEYCERIGELIPELYRNCIDRSKTTVSRDMMWEGRVMPRRTPDDVWLLFTRRYGLDRVDLDNFVAELACIDTIPFIVGCDSKLSNISRVMNILVERDC